MPDYVPDSDMPEAVPDSDMPGKAKVFNSALDSFGRGMTMAPASAFFDALIPGLDETKFGKGYFDEFGERFKRSKAYYDQVNQRAQAENPNAYAGGQIATGLMGAVAASPAAGAMGPLSYLSRGGGSIMGEALPASINALTHAGAGVMDAALMNMGIAAATNADKSKEEIGAAMQNAAQSPANLLGMANALPDVVAAAPAAAQEWRDVGNRMRTRREAPQNAEAQRVFEERHGSPEAAGEAMRQFERADRPGTTARERADVYDFERKTAGAEKGGLIEQAEMLGGKGDPEAVLARMQAYRNRRYGWEPEGNAATRNTPEDLAAMQKLDETIRQFRETYQETYHPTGTNVEYQGGVQGEFGPTSTTQTYEGQRLQPGTPTEVVGVSREVSNAQATDRPYRQPMAGERVPAGSIRLSGEPRVGDTQLNLSYQRGIGGHPTEPNWSASLTPEQSATYPQTLRPNPEAPVHVNLQHEPYSAVPTTETATQPSLFPQSTTAAGEWAPHTFPDAPPGTGGTPGGPVATSTNVVVRGQPVGLWSKLKTRWDAITKQRASKGYPIGTPREVIANDPHLRDMDELSNILRAEEDAIAQRTLSPADYKRFVAAKQRQHDAETFFPFAKMGGHAETAGASAESAGVLHPSRAGTVAWLERLFAAPARSRIGIPGSDAMNRFATEQANMTPRASMFGKPRNLSAEAIAAEIIRKAEEEREYAP